MTDDLTTKESVINEIARFRGYLDDDMIYRIQTAIKRLPTVDAIPIEWVNKWIKEHESWGWGEAKFTSSVEIMVSDFLKERMSNYMLPGFTVTPNAERKDE